MLLQHHLKALEPFDYVITEYATQQALVRAATKHRLLIRPRLLTPNEFLELVTFALPSTWEGFVYEHLSLEPGFASIVAEMLRAPKAHEQIPTNLQSFYQLMFQEGHIKPRSLISPTASIALLGPIPFLVEQYVSAWNPDIIDFSSLDVTLDYTLYDTQYNEVVGVFDEVVSYIDDQSLDSIALLVPEQNYRPILDTIASRYEIPLQWQQGEPLIHHPMIQTVHQQLDAMEWSSEEFLELISPLIQSEDDTLQSIYTQLLRLISDYQALTFSPKTMKVVIKHALSKLSYREPRLKHVLKVYTSIHQFIEADYVIVLGVNQGSFPAVYSSTALISNSLRATLGLSTNEHKTSYAVDEFLWFCRIQGSVWCTAKKRSLDRLYAPSLIFSSSNPLIPFRDKNVNFDFENRYSIPQDLLMYKKEHHRQRRQGFFTDELAFLHLQFEDQMPAAYDNKFKGISANTLKEFPTPNAASYSSLNSFFHCQFRYWMEQVLSVDPFETSPALYLGNMSHYVMKELGYDFGGENYEDKVQQYAKEYLHEIQHELTFSMTFYLNHMIVYLTRAVSLMQQFQQYSKFELQFIEQELSQPLKESLMTLRGVVDHVSMYESPEGIQHVLIVDYKSGKTDTGYAKVEYGIDCQLFVYMLMIRNANLVDDPYFSGAFQFSLFPSDVPHKDPKKTFQQQIDAQLGFDGFVENDVNTFKTIYENDDSLFNVSLTKANEFHKSYKKTFHQESMHSLLNLLNQKIEEASLLIHQGQFVINPKAFFGEKKHTLDLSNYREDNSCKYCHLKDVCYRTEEDFTKIKKDRDQTFEDVINAMKEHQGGQDQ